MLIGEGIGNFKMYYHAAVLSAKSLDQSQQSK